MNFKPMRNHNRGWMHLLVMALTILTTASAFASPSINIAPASMFRPRGAVRVQLIPGGPADYWVGDGAQGFCRIDNGVLKHCHLLSERNLGTV